MKIQKNHKFILAIVGAITLLVVGISFSMNAAVLEGRLNSTKNTPAMASENTRELKPPKDPMEAESEDEIKGSTPWGMETESKDK